MEVTPQIVQVIGPKAILESLVGFVETEVIDIDGAQADIEKDALLNLPDGVTLRGDEQLVQISIKIEALQGNRNLTIEPIIVGLQANLNARISPESVDVFLVGDLPVLDRVDLHEDVRLTLDLSELDVGTYQIEPSVETPEGIVAQSLIPASIQVIIESGPPRTPTPIATPDAEDLTPTATSQPY